MTTPSEILDAAADLIEPDGRWTQGAWARDAKLKPTREDGPESVCFCLYGALFRAAGQQGIWQPETHLREVLQYPNENLISWNDDPARKQTEVVSALRRAADLARAAETTPETADQPEGQAT